MKRIIASILAAAMLGASLLGTGCGFVTKGSDYCIDFLEKIRTQQYAEAYEMLADSIKAPETAEERAARLEKEAKEKEEKKQETKSFWRGLIGLDEPAEETPTPTPTPETTTPDPEATPDPININGRTPDPETGEYPEITATPDVGAEDWEDPLAEPDLSGPGIGLDGTDNDEFEIPDDADAVPVDAEPTPEPTPTPVVTPAPDADAKKHASVTPEPTATPTGNADEIKKTITKNEFIEKYQAIMDELMVDADGIEYVVTDVTDGEIIAIVDYTLTYHSRQAGTDLTYDFEITANRIEHRWTIDWSPTLIFPQMQWGDNLRVGTLQANRGEILCGGVPYAQNIPKVTVFAVPSSIEDMDTFVSEVAAIPELEMTEADVIEKVSKARNDFSKFAEFFPDEMSKELEDRILGIKGMAIDTANYGTLRYYPYGQSLCHIIGYAGIIAKKEKINYEVYGDITYDKELDKYITSGTTRYNGDSWIGKYGLELLYEDKLLGTNGRFTYIQDSKGGSRGMLYKTDAIEGNDLHLTIIPELQERLEDIISTTVYDSSLHGCVIVLNPKTGAIQAMTSWPGFDLNDLARGVPEEEWEAMQNDPTIPLYNRATQGLYTPGSVFKTMTSAAILETGTLTTIDEFPATENISDSEDTWMPSEDFMATLQRGTFGEPLTGVDEMTFAEQAYDKPIKRTRNTNRHTPMNLINSIIDSDNIFFAWAALRIGANKFEEYMTQKLDWNTPIQLENEGTSPRIYWSIEKDGFTWKNQATESGQTRKIYKYNEAGELVPITSSDGGPVNLVLDKKIDGMDVSTPQLYSTYKQQSYYDTAVTGYGQGQILMSPLQIACYVSAYANEGKVMQPYVVDSIWHADGTDYTLVEQRTPKVYKQLLNKETVETIYPALLKVPHEGTAQSMYKSFLTKAPLQLGYQLAGKTGTAEITDNKTKELAWFICWRDTDDETGEKVTEEDARLVCILLEVDLIEMENKPEWKQMKYDIARAMLKKDILNNDDVETK